MASLDLKISGRVQRCIADVLAELRECEITFEPNFFLGDNDFWTSDRAISINVPWFLADKRTWEIADRNEDLEYSPEDAERCLRHEIGHALNYAFELWKRPDWTAVFGDFEAPYADDFTPAPEKAGDFVEYLTDVPQHYAQKHPDEAWAEAFAFWLDPRTDSGKLDGAALDKFNYVDQVASPILRGEPPVTRLGRPIPYTRIRGTVGQVLDAVDEDEETKREWVEMIAFLKMEGVLPLFNEIWRSPGKPMDVDLFIDDRSERPGNWRELADEFGALTLK